MNYKDIWAVDESGDRFIFTVEMQRKLSEMGLPVEPEYLKEVDDMSPPPVRQHQETEARTTRERPARKNELEPVSEDFDAPATIQIDPQTGKYIGRMKWYNMKKGYGFIVRGGGEEIFFHKTGTVGDPHELQEGQWILYDVEETHKGPEATDVEPYEGDVDLLT